MDLSRFFKNPNAVYSQKTLRGIGMGLLTNFVWLNIFFMAIFGYASIAGAKPDVLDVALFVLCVVAANAVIEAWLRSRVNDQLKHHTTDLAAFSNQYGYDFHPLPLHLTQAFQHSSLLALGERNRRIHNAITAQGWQYIEFSYAIYHRTKHSEYHAETVYYGAISTKLPRRLPHVFFDSKHARGRQFRWIFSRDQKHSLEGDFDQYFTTYFPPDYTIDGLSFITPEVMWALKEAGEFDIEIVDDRLYLYAPIYDDENRLHDMAVKLEAVEEKLLHNIGTYRDERLPGMKGRMGVSGEGFRLRRSQFFKRLTLAFIIAYVLYYFWSFLQQMRLP